MPSTINVNWISSTITDGGKVSPSMDKTTLIITFHIWNDTREDEYVG